jgi:DNA-binding IclR family transcriptional regulator
MSERSSAPDRPERKYATPALEKGLDVLELLAHQPAGLTKSQVARELGRTVSEIFRMLVTLEQRGYITQVDQDRYVLTLKLFRLVQEHPPTERLVVDANTILQRIAHDTLQSCHLGVLEGGLISILAQANPPFHLGFYVRLGSTVDIMESASGYVILAHLPAEQRARVIEAWRRDTGKRPPRDLEEHLRRIARAGYEKRGSYQTKGVLNISFPVFDQRGAALGAITIPYIEYIGETPSLAQVTETLREAAAELTTRIGGVMPR